MTEPLSDTDPEPELLVHVTASASAKHDAGYRALAKSTIEFETATQFHLGTVSWPREDITLAYGGPVEQVEEDSYDVTRSAKRRNIETSTNNSGRASIGVSDEAVSVRKYSPQTSLSGSPQRFFTPPVEVASATTSDIPSSFVSSTPLPQPQAISFASTNYSDYGENGYADGEGISWRDLKLDDDPLVSLGSSIPDSQLTYDGTKTLIELSSPPIACSTPRPSQQKGLMTFSPFQLSQGIEKSSGRLEIPSSHPSLTSQASPEIPSSPVPPSETSISRVLDTSIRSTQITETTLSSSSLPSSPYRFSPQNPNSTTYTLTLPPPPLSSLPRLNLTPSPPSTQFTQPSLTSALPSHLPPFNLHTPLPTLVPPPYTIFPPTPATSSNPPIFPPTWKNYLMSQTDYLTRYPQLLKHQSRQIQRWERGYWRLDLGRWGDAKEKTQFWNMVKGGVENGRMGNCSMRLEGGSDVEERLGETRAQRKLNPTKKEMEERGKKKEGEKKGEGEEDDDDDDDDDDGWRFTCDWEKEQGGGNVVRVYCFGGAVQYVWAMLYIFSFKKCEGMVWVDSAGKEVLKF